MTSTIEALENFITADDQLHRAAMASADTYEIAWDDATRTYTADDRTAVVTTLIDEDSSVETGWEWTLTGSTTPTTSSCSTDELDLIRSSVVQYLTH